MFDLVDNNPELLKEFEVVASDRKYQLGKGTKRIALSHCLKVIV